MVNGMSFHWLGMRITEENDRRRRQAEIAERMPRALEEVHQALATCAEDYQQAFGAQSVELQLSGAKISILVRGEKDGQWEQIGRVEIATVNSLPGFQIDRGGEPLVIEVGVLPTGKLFYRDREQDQYLTMEDLTKRVLDRAFFPKLGE